MNVLLLFKAEDVRRDTAYLFFFFKQKTAYEMHISDWSSEVCSSDLIICLWTCCSDSSARLQSDSGQTPRTGHNCVLSQGTRIELRARDTRHERNCVPHIAYAAAGRVSRSRG